MRLTWKDAAPAAPLRYETRVPAWAAAVCVVGGLVGTFWLDRSTGDSPVQHLYYVSIILAAGRFGWRGGLAASLAAIALYHVANEFVYTSRYIESDIVQVVLFLLVGLVTAKLVSDAEHLRRLSRTDDLTGLHNLRSFEMELSRMVRQARPLQEALSLLAIDVDHLKELNDRYGHLTGAEAVRHIGRVIAERLPEGAVACRYGGDEFVIAIPGCSEERAAEVGNALCRAVHDGGADLAGRSFPPSTLSISVGAASRRVDDEGGARRLGGDCPAGASRRGDRAGASSTPADDAEDGETLFHAADAALYAAKAAGRNRVCRASDRPGDRLRSSRAGAATSSRPA
jgi:diguanylate cyclase (GGDEF)-like protein